MLQVMEGKGRAEQRNTHALIHDLHGEELAIAARVAPGADAALVGDPGADGPPTGHRAV